MTDFAPFSKIPRYFRDVCVTEKIDGTNAQIYITKSEQLIDNCDVQPIWGNGSYGVYAGSRSRLIWPNGFDPGYDKSSCKWLNGDNFGFAKWVSDNAEALIELLGYGRHYGEWWGSGIQRNYGLDHKRFSLFNTHLFGDLNELGGSLTSVPVLYDGPNNPGVMQTCLKSLSINGSCAAPGFTNPEGVVMFHTASGNYYKATLENDGQPKGTVTSMAK